MTVIDQDQLLQWIRDYMRSNGWSPSIREIGRAFDVSSPSTTHYHLVRMESEGLIERGDGPRQIKLTVKGKEKTL